MERQIYRFIDISNFYKVLVGLEFKRISDRPLQLIDCQNIFCELDKYCRQALSDLKSNRTRIKKHYVPKKDKIEYVYPIKWKI